MSSVTYAIVFKGEVLQGHDVSDVKMQMAKLLKADAAKVKALFSGKQVVIKRTQDKQEAAKYANVLKRVGADIKVRAIQADKQSASAAKPDAKPSLPPLEDTQPALPPLEAAQTSALPSLDAVQAAAEPEPEPASEQTVDETPVAPDVSGISLAPNIGNLVEPSEEPPPPDIDLSSIELAENDGTPLVEPGEVVEVDLDLSEYSVKENDGTPLVETTDEPVPEVDVPEFGLDEPGAMLETEKETLEIVVPDTAGITIAITGTELLGPEERDQEPPPPPPDTSKIHLVPNFDI